MWLPSPIVRFLWGTPVLRDAMQKRLNHQRREIPVFESEFFRPSNFSGDNIPHFQNLNWVIRIPVPPGDEGNAWGDLYFARDLASALANLGQNVRIDRRNAVLNQEDSDDVYLVIRGLEKIEATPSRTNVLWIISTPELVTRHELNQFQLIYAAGPQWAKDYSKKSGINIQPMLQCTDLKRFNPENGSPDAQPGIVFVGNARKKIRKIIKDSITARLPIRIYGKGWKALVPADLIANEFISNNELSKFYRESTIVLNDHRPDMAKQGFLSNRLFDAVASGARVISDFAPGISDVFGANVQVYRNPAELVSLSQSLDAFGSIEYRNEQAEIIRREHSFDARAKQFVADVCQLRNGQKENVS